MAARNPYRGLPSVDRVLADERVRALSAEYSGDTVVTLVREELDAVREAIAGGGAAPPLEAIVAAVGRRARSALAPSLRPTINATGVIIHTNLGRAPLSDEALAAMAEAARGYSNLEFDLEAGERGSRHVHLEEQLRRLTGAEAAFAVNNNASAVLLALSALAARREVVISRGQLVEIGGGFRIPDVMAQSDAFLAEIGTTNRTYLRDYEEAITEHTAALMRVHASNFKVVGFTASVSIQELAQLARERRLYLIDDLGSGCLLDTARFGLPPEPTPQESLAAGADLVLFSGDKLLGGPQAGIIAGRREVVERLRRHPLARAVRIDKVSIAGLAATLNHYLKDEAAEKVPVWRMIAAPVDGLARRARRWARAAGRGATVVDGRSMVGGGSLPEEGLPTKLLALPATPERPAEALARRLRAHDPPVVARIERDTVLLDPRTVHPREDRVVVEALRAALGESNGS
ncbi:MAG: L-seryl-tRNA(Sec) selenium transferase [Chloroflexi bacterium RBG_16_68_14]|nr:MAG: L-seryl-tRNA(Sec) selenium transferase [Chloroflexi bacterium RBG_16_68_14]